MSYCQQVSDYIDSLDDQEKRIAQKVRHDYLRNGKSMGFVNCAFRMLHGRSIRKYQYLMFNQQFLDEVHRHYLFILAKDLDSILSAHAARPQNWETLCSLIDMEGYHIQKRRIGDQLAKGGDIFDSGTIEYILSLLQEMNEFDIRQIEWALDNEVMQ